MRFRRKPEVGVIIQISDDIDVVISPLVTHFTQHADIESLMGFIELRRLAQGTRAGPRHALSLRPMLSITDPSPKCHDSVAAASAGATSTAEMPPRRLSEYVIVPPRSATSGAGRASLTMPTYDVARRIYHDWRAHGQYQSFLDTSPRSKHCNAKEF